MRKSRYTRQVENVDYPCIGMYAITQPLRIVQMISQKGVAKDKNLSGLTDMSYDNRQTDFFGGYDRLLEVVVT